MSRRSRVSPWFQPWAPLAVTKVNVSCEFVDLGSVEALTASMAWAPRTTLGCRIPRKLKKRLLGLMWFPVYSWRGNLTCHAPGWNGSVIFK